MIGLTLTSDSATISMGTTSVLGTVGTLGWARRLTIASVGPRMPVGVVFNGTPLKTTSPAKGSEPGPKNPGGSGVPMKF